MIAPHEELVGLGRKIERAHVRALGRARQDRKVGSAVAQLIEHLFRVCQKADGDRKVRRYFANDRQDRKNVEAKRVVVAENAKRAACFFWRKSIRAGK